MSPAKRHKAPPAVCNPSKKPLSPDVVGQRVRVHPHLNNGCYSVASLTDKRVLGYTKGLRLRDVTVHFSEAGYERCHEGGERNVHACLDGTLVEIGVEAEGPPPGWRRLRYNCLVQEERCILYEDNRACFVAAAEVIGLSRARMWASPVAAPQEGAVVRALDALRRLAPGRLRTPDVLAQLARGGG